ncbi:MAG: EAL domain-containing protein [Clostridiales bacterium]
MIKLSKIRSEYKSTYRTAVIAFVLICLVMSILCMQYYNKLQNTLKEENSGYMQEISTQMSTNVNKNIIDNFSVLGTIGTVLQSSNVVSFSQLQTVVLEQQKYWNYQKVMLIDENGVAFDYEGKTVSLNNDEYLQNAIVDRKPSMSSSQVIDGKDCIVFAIPLNGVVIEGNKILALAASYDLSSFDKILAMTAFEGRGYAHIVRADGTVVIRSSSKNASQTGYNVLNSLKNSQIKDNKTMADVQVDIANGKSGQIEYVLDDTHEYMTYTPLDMEEWSLLTFVPVSVVNAKSELLLQVTLILCGFITLAFSLLIVFLIISFYRNKRKLENIAYVDIVTGGYTIQRFYEIAHETLKKSTDIQYALVYINIEKFKVLNEEFGRDACDNVLQGIENGIGASLNANECMGRLYADNFCVLIEYKNEKLLAPRLEQWYKSCADDIKLRGFAWLPLIMEFGVYVIDNNAMGMPYIVDRAKLALTETTKELRGKLRYAIYNEDLRRHLLREKYLEDMMENALENKEFQVYLQPKFFTQSEKIGGAEALVRWESALDGMIYPDEFIPMFEKNGFIITLDLWVFELVCKTISKWINAGIEPIKISVNCSRLHLKNPDFLDRYCDLQTKYNIPPKYIEFEITETAVFEDVSYLTETIKKIHSMGFGCSMDDFGSGYSSLNLIQNIPVDTLKLDRVFFHTEEKNLLRTESIVGSVISMSKALSMQTVAEGVEELAQVNMLKKLGCDYIQGYYFAKPMPIGEFEKLAYNHIIEDVGESE